MFRAIPFGLGGGGGGGDSAYERGGDAWKFCIKRLKETDLGVAQAFFLFWTPKRDHVKTQTIHIFLHFFACNSKRDLHG